MTLSQILNASETDDTDQGWSQVRTRAQEQRILTALVQGQKNGI